MELLTPRDAAAETMSEPQAEEKEPDVFETEDPVGLDNSTTAWKEDENDAIDTADVAAQKSYEVFASTVPLGGADYSGSAEAYARFRAHSMPRGSLESPLQKLERLKMETEQLQKFMAVIPPNPAAPMCSLCFLSAPTSAPLPPPCLPLLSALALPRRESISAPRATPPNPAPLWSRCWFAAASRLNMRCRTQSAAGQEGFAGTMYPPTVTDELATLQGQIAGIAGQMSADTPITASLTSSTADKLMQDLSSFTAANEAGGKKGKKGAAAAEGGSSSVTYELFVEPQSASTPMNRVADMERRLAALEKATGVTEQVELGQCSFPWPTFALPPPAESGSAITVLCW